MAAVVPQVAAQVAAAAVVAVQPLALPVTQALLAPVGKEIAAATPFTVLPMLPAAVAVVIAQQAKQHL